MQILSFLPFMVIILSIMGWFRVVRTAKTSKRLVSTDSNSSLVCSTVRPVSSEDSVLFWARYGNRLIFFEVFLCRLSSISSVVSKAVLSVVAKASWSVVVESKSGPSSFLESISSTRSRTGGVWPLIRFQYSFCYNVKTIVSVTEPEPVDGKPVEGKRGWKEHWLVVSK